MLGSKPAAPEPALDVVELVLEPARPPPPVDVRDDDEAFVSSEDAAPVVSRPRWAPHAVEPNAINSTNR
jgi:hypothetical protein